MSEHTKELDKIINDKADDILKKFELKDEFGVKKAILVFEFRDVGLKIIEIIAKESSKTT